MKIKLTIMKSYLKIFSISILSCFISIITYDTYNNMEYREKNDKLTRFEKAIPNYVSFNSNLSSSNEKTDFTLAAKKTINAVVHIKNTSNYKDNSDNWLYRLYGESTPKRIGNGSGVIVSPDGYIITNNHVVENASEVEVLLNDNRSFIAKVEGTDPTTDIAVLKIEAENLSTIEFGNSDNVEIGEWVLAVGSPLNLDQL